jgi:hypothetical protein
MTRRERRRFTTNLSKTSPLFNGEAPHGTPEGNKLIHAAIMEPIRNTGVFSLSEKQNDILMWGHYAASHTGICIGFATLEMNDALHRIVYQDERPVINPMRDQATLIEKGLLTKSSQWAYEREWRILGRQQIGRVGISQSAIRGIILGARISASDEALVRQWAKDGFLTVSWFRARLSDTSFSMTIEPVP